MNQPDLFIKVPVELLSLGLPSRLLHLYGRLRLHAGKDGKCWVTHDKLAEEIGLRSIRWGDRQVRNLLTELRRLRLISWQRRRYWSDFVVYPPDRKWISDLIASDRKTTSDLTGNKFPLCNVSERKKISDRKDVGFKRSSEKKASQPAVNVVAETTAAASSDGRLAGLLTEVWQHLPGSPGPKLVARIAGTLGDVPIEHFQILLLARRKDARGFGLAAQLAIEARNRWESEREQQEQAAATEAAAEDQRQIRLMESLLADPGTPEENRPELKQWLNELRNKTTAPLEPAGKRKKAKCHQH